MHWFNPRSWFRKPHPLIVENQRHFSEFDQSRPLADYSFVVIDTELTGLNRTRDEILSIGGVRIRNLQIDLGDTFYCVVRPTNLSSTAATVIHQLSPERLERARPLEDVLPDFVSFVSTSLLVGHYLSLDMAFLNRATWTILGGMLSNPGVDTMRMAQGYNRIKRGYFSAATTPESYRLDDLGREYNLPKFTAHNAFEDAMQTACLFLWLLKKFSTGGITSLKDLYRAGRQTGL